ncbi:MAG: hypothetical protein R6V17_02680 [Halanaerobacter sp.]
MKKEDIDRERCILTAGSKPCTNCGECLICDLDDNKKCDNCMECIDMEGFNAVGITGVDYDGEEGLNLN